MQLVTRLCAERAGLRIDPEKHYLAENRLAPVARREGFSSIEEFLGAVRDRDEERLIWALVEAMSPSETAQKVLPELARRGEGRPLRLWAASCGTGQEVYSLAMLLAEQSSVGATFELTGSDLCERRLEKAQSGLYSQFEVQRGLSAHRLVRHFENAEEGFALSPRIRSSVRWRRVNLIEDVSRMGRFDLVLCRGLTPQLTDAARERVLANLVSALAPGGVLALGPAETAPGLVAAPGLAGFQMRAEDRRVAA
jgi:chemotaxis protein methyltransferase CheR